MLGNKSLKEALYLKVTVTEGKKTIKQGRWLTSKSWVLQWLQLQSILNGAPIQNVRDTGNTLRTPNLNSGNGQYCTVLGGAGSTTDGIVLGSNNTAPTTSDFVINTLIAQGVGAGQLQYAAGSTGFAAIVGANVDYDMIRSMTNGSGGDVIVREIAIYGLFVYAGPVNGRFCLVRDVVADITVANGQTITITYKRRTTV